MAALIKYFTKIIGLSKANKPRYCSSIEVLAKIMPRKEFEQLFLSISDRRVVLRCAAERLGYTEEGLTEHIATISKLEFVKRAPQLELDKIPSTLTLAELRQAGATLKIIENSLVGIICIDPIMVERLILDRQKLPTGLPISLACWSEIERALASAETEFEQKQRAQSEEQATAARKFTTRIMELLIAEVESYRQNKLELEIGENVYYRFLTAAGITATGSIDSQVKETLRCGIDAIVKGGTYFFRSNSSLIEKLELSINEKPQTTCYSFSWKAPWVEALPAPQRETTLSEIAQQKYNQQLKDNPVLIVDDNPTFAKVLGKFLAKQGFSTCYQSDSREALALLRAGEIRPVLVVCDVHMPGFGGKDFLREIKTDALLLNLPVIMLTSDSSLETEIELTMIGADAFITKDEDTRLLAAQLIRLAERSLSLRTAA